MCFRPSGRGRRVTGRGPGVHDAGRRCARARDDATFLAAGLEPGSVGLGGGSRRPRPTPSRSARRALHSAFAADRAVAAPPGRFVLGRGRPEARYISPGRAGGSGGRGRRHSSGADHAPAGRAGQRGERAVGQQDASSCSVAVTSSPARPAVSGHGQDPARDQSIGSGRRVARGGDQPVGERGRTCARGRRRTARTGPDPMRPAGRVGELFGDEPADLGPGTSGSASVSPGKARSSSLSNSSFVAVPVATRRVRCPSTPSANQLAESAR